MVNSASEVAVAASKRGQRNARLRVTGVGGWNKRSWIFAEGGRGIQFAKRCSDGFGVFMIDAFEGGFEPGDAVAITAGDGIGRHGEELPYLLKGVSVPDLEDDDLALFAGKVGERAHGGGLGGFAGGGGFEPAFGFEFAGQSPPDAAAVVQGAVAKAPQAVMLGIIGSAGDTEQGHESFLEDILGFVMGEAKGTAVEEEEGGFGVIQLFTPSIVIDGLAHPGYSLLSEFRSHLH
jgi:hypothetical protein